MMMIRLETNMGFIRTMEMDGVSVAKMRSGGIWGGLDLFRLHVMYIYLA